MLKLAIAVVPRSVDNEAPMMGSASCEIRFSPWMLFKGARRRLERILRYSHLQGALFEYDHGHAQNREVLAYRIPFIVRTRS